MGYLVVLLHLAQDMSQNFAPMYGFSGFRLLDLLHPPRLVDHFRFYSVECQVVRLPRLVDGGTQSWWNQYKIRCCRSLPVYRGLRMLLLHGRVPLVLRLPQLLWVSVAASDADVSTHLRWCAGIACRCCHLPQLMSLLIGAAADVPWWNPLRGAQSGMIYRGGVQSR